MQYKPDIRYKDNPTKQLNIDYSLVYKSCFPMIRNMVMKNNGTEDDADDLFQDAILILFQNSTHQQFELRVNTCTYLYSVARNLWLRNVRTYDKRTGLDELNHLHDNLDAIDNDERKHRQLLLIKHLGNIGPKCQEMLRLFFEGIQGEQICKQLEFSSYEYYRVAKNRCIENLKKLIRQDPLFKELIH